MEQISSKVDLPEVQQNENKEIQQVNLDIKPFSCILAYCRQNMGIGFENNLPWPFLKADMKHFAKVTTSVESITESSLDNAAKSVFFNSALKQKIQERQQAENVKQDKMNAIIMGRKTWESLPDKIRPLKNRLNVILTKNPDDFNKYCRDGDKLNYEGHENILVFADFEEALVALSKDQRVNEMFVIGGSSLYEMSMNKYKNYCKLFITTRINKKFECDTFIPSLENPETNTDFAPLHVSETYSQDDITFDYVFYGNTEILSQKPELVPSKLMKQYPKHTEMQYLESIEDIIATGKYKDDRTGTGIYSKFGRQMRYDLNQSFPILTTKDTYWRGIAEELVWFVNGETNAKLLHDKKVKIWDGNASREFLDKIGLKDREEWDLGPVYGFQWRHFGAAYETMHSDYTHQGVDQLADVINLIKTNPTSRRIVMTAWNPSALKDMALPPCHILAQFYVTGDKNPRLSCQMYQRSCDMGLGVPFNIASYALLTCMLAQVCGLERGEFIHTLGDTHVYSNHVEPLKVQLQRMPHPFPILNIDPSIKEIDKFEFSHFKLVNYTHDKKIKMEMAV